MSTILVIYWAVFAAFVVVRAGAAIFRNTQQRHKLVDATLEDYYATPGLWHIARNKTPPPDVERRLLGRTDAVFAI